MVRRWVISAAALGALQLVVLVTLALAGPDDHTHDAPVGVVAPPVVAQIVIDAANDLPGHPVDVSALDTSDQARQSVRGGTSIAAVVVDLSEDQDVVYVSSANGSEVNRAVLQQIREVELSFGRTVVVRDAAPTLRGDGDARGVYLLVGTCILLGFLAPIVITWLRGPVAPTARRGVVRVLTVGASSVVIGLGLGAVAAARYDTGIIEWWLLSALLMFATTSTTLAFESLFGVLGIGLATTLFVLAAAPLIRLGHPLLLPQPWSVITPWLPHGAALEAGRAAAYFGGSVARPFLVLTAWSLLAVVVLADARRERSVTEVRSRRRPRVGTGRLRGTR